MRLICPNCVAQYEVDQDVIPPEGRDVQCANCGHNWFQDSIQMFSADPDTPFGAGDPDSDVPPELFNDLEGKLSTPFASARANVSPNPDDLEPEEPRDDFQIEQEPAAPSSRMDQDALDMLREEAEYSSGEKPPAAAEAPQEQPIDEPAEEITPEETPSEPPVEDNLNVDDILSDIPELPEVSETEIPPIDEVENTETVEVTPELEDDQPDDLDEIRRRIMELENVEEVAQTSLTVEPVEAVDDTKPDALDDLVLPELEPIPEAEIDEPIPSRPSDVDNPFSRPSASGARSTPQEKPDDLYEENIPSEEILAETTAPSDIDLVAEQTEPDQSIDAEIAALVSEKDKEEAGTKRSARKITPRAFPTGDAEPDTLYGAAKSDRKDMFPDVDELTSELIHDADSIPEEELAAQATKAKSKGGFLRGFTLAVLLFIIIGLLYFLAPVISEYVPQLAGPLSTLTNIVNQLVSAAAPLIDMIKGLI